MAEETHVLAVGYAHVRGGEDSFLRAADSVVQGGKKSETAVNAVDRSLGTLHGRLKQTPGVAAAAVSAMRDVATMRGPARFSDDVDKANQALKRGMADLRLYRDRMKEVAAAEARAPGGGEAVRQRHALDDRVSTAQQGLGVGANSRAGQEVRKLVEQEEAYRQSLLATARANEEAASAARDLEAARSKVTTNLADLEREVEDTRRLASAKKLGEEAYRREVASIAARNAAMHLGSAATKEEIEKARALATELAVLTQAEQKVGNALSILPGRAGALASMFTALKGAVAGLSAGVLIAVGVLAALAGGFMAVSAGVSRALDALGPFEQSMRNVQAASGASDEELKKLSNTALELSQNTRFSPKQAAEGLYALSSAGFSANEQLKALPQTLSFAEAAQADLGQATETVVGALKVFDLQADQSKRVADVFTASIAVSSLNADRLQIAMRNAGPAASAMNQSFEGTVAALAVLTNKMNSGELAGTGLKTALLQVSEKAKEFGISVKDAHGNLLPLPDLIERMEKKGISGAKAIHILGSEAGPAMAALLATGSEALRKMEADLTANGQAAGTAAKQIDTYEGQQAKLANSISVFWIRVGQAIVGGQRSVLSDMTSMVQGATDWVISHANQIKSAADRIATVMQVGLRAAGVVVKATIVILSNLKDIVIAVGIAFIGWKLGAITQGLTSAAAATGALTKAVAFQEAVVALLTKGWRAMTAAMAANPLGAIAVALSLVYLGLDKLIDRSKAASDAFLDMNAKQSEGNDILIGLRDTYELSQGGVVKLVEKVKLLTAAEIENARAALAAKDALASMAFAKVAELEKQRAAVSKELLFTRDGSKEIALRGEYGRLAEQIRGAHNEAKVLRFEFNTGTEALNLHEEALKKLEKKTNDNTNAAGDFDKKLAQLLRNLRLAAEDAERLAAARLKGATVAEAERLAAERRNAVLQAEVSLGSKIGNQIEEFIARRQRADRALAETEAIEQVAITRQNSLRQATAAVADAVAGNTLASDRLSTQLEAEEAIRSRLLPIMSASAKALLDNAQMSAQEAQQSSAVVRAINDNYEWSLKLKQAKADLVDATHGETKAADSLAVEMEVANKVRSAGVSLYSLEGTLIAGLVRSRDAELASIKATTAAEAQRLRYRKELAQLKAEVSDWQQQSAAILKYGSEIAGILTYYGRLSDASRKLAAEEEARQLSKVKGETRSYEAILKEIQAQQQAIDVVNNLRIAEGLAAYAVQPIREAWSSWIDEAKSTLIDFVVTGKANWEDLAKSLLKSMLSAIVEMVIRWVAGQKVMQAEAIKTGIIAAAATKGGGTSGASGIAGGVSQMAGGASALYGGGSSAGASAGATAGTVAAIAIWAIVLYGLIKGFTEKGFSSGSATIGSAGTGANGQSGVSTSGNNGRLMEIARRHMQEMIAQVNELAKQWGVGLEALAEGSVTLGKTSEGVYFVESAFGGLTKIFKTAEEAIDYAKVLALKFAKFSADTSALIQAVIHNTRATTTAELNSEIDVARTIDSFSAEKFQNELHASIAELDKLRDAISRLIPPSQELTDAYANLNAEEARRWQSVRDQITGRQRTAQEELADRRHQAEMFNAELALRIADLKMKRAELVIARENLIARGQIIAAGGGLDNADLTNQASYLVAKSTLLKIEGSMYDRLLASIDANIAAIDATIASLPKPIDIENEVKLPRGGRGGKGDSPFDNLLQMIRDVDTAIARSKLSDYARQIAEINDRWNAAIKEAGGGKSEAERLAAARKQHEEALRAAGHNGDAVNRLNAAYERQIRHIHETQQTIDAANAARQREIEAAKEQARIALSQELKPYLGDFGKGQFELSLSELRTKFEDLRKRSKELGMSLADVAKAEANAKKALGQQAISSLNLPTQQVIDQMKQLADTMKFLEDNAKDLGLSEKDLANIRKQVGQQQYLSLLDGLNQFIQDEGVKKELTQARYDLEIANMRLQFELLKAQKILTKEQIERIEGLFGKLPKEAPGNAPTGPDLGAIFEQRAQEAAAAAAELAKNREDLIGKIKEWEDLRLSGPEKELRDLNAQFEQMRTDAVRLGVDVGRVQAAYRTALDDFFKRLKQGIKDLRDSLDFADYSPLSAEQRLQQAQANFNDLAARAQAGDLSAYEKIPEAAQRLLDEARGFYNSGVGFQQIFAQVKAVLDLLLANQAAPASGVTGAAQASAPAQGALGTLLPFPTASGAPTGGIPTPAQQSAPVIVVQQGAGGDGEVGKKIDEMREKLEALEREQLRAAFESQDIAEKALAVAESTEAQIARLVGAVERLLGKMAGQEPPQQKAS